MKRERNLFNELQVLTFSRSKLKIQKAVRRDVFEIVRRRIDNRIEQEISFVSNPIARKANALYEE